jgi:symplekin
MFCRLFHKLLLDAPLVTPNALQILRQACMDTVCLFVFVQLLLIVVRVLQVYGRFGMNTLREMIMSRPRQRIELLQMFVTFALCERVDIRQQCLDAAKELIVLRHVKQDLRVCCGCALFC